MRTGSLPSHQDHGGGSSSLLALIGAWNAVLRCTSGFAKETSFRSDGPCLVSTCDDSQEQNKCACAVDGLPPTSLSPQQPFHSTPILGCIVSPGALHAMEKKKVLDGRCIVSPGLKFHSSVRQRTGSRISRSLGEEPSEDDKPFLPRFLLQEIIFAHSPYEGVFRNQS